MAKTVKKLGKVKNQEQTMLMEENDVKSDIADGSILIKMMLQIAGSPAKHIEKTMELVIEKIQATKGVKMATTKVYRPRQDDNDKQMHISLADLDILVKDLNVLTGLCYDYMPASIEIIEPTDLRFSAFDITMFLNDILARLHKMDMVLKNNVAQNTILNRNCIALFKNIFKISLKSGPKTREELSLDTGISSVEIEPLVKGMIQDGLIYEKEGRIYEKNGK